MKQMATKNIKFQQNVSATIQDLQTQIGQLATTVNQLQQQGSGNIPTQPTINPKGNVSAITLRSARELLEPINAGAKIDESAKTDFAPKWNLILIFLILLGGWTSIFSSWMPSNKFQNMQSS